MKREKYLRVIMLFSKIEKRVNLRLGSREIVVNKDLSQIICVTSANDDIKYLSDVIQFLSDTDSDTDIYTNHRHAYASKNSNGIIFAVASYSQFEFGNIY